MTFGAKLASCLFTLFLTLAAMPAQAWDNKDFTGDKAEFLMKVLDNMAHVADGEDSGKRLYVLFEPGCPACKAFYQASRANSAKVQIRWIPVDLSGELNSMFETSAGDVLKDAFTNSRLPADENPDRTAGINRYNMSALVWLISSKYLSGDGSLAFPTFIYGNAEKAHVSIGMDPGMTLDKLAPSIPAVEVNKDAVPEALRFADEKFEVIPTPGVNEYKTGGTGNKVLRFVPSSEAMKVGEFPEGATLPVPVSGVTKNGYVVIDLNGQKTYMYIEDEDAAREAQKKKK